MRRLTVIAFIFAAALMSLPVNLLAQEQPERTLNVVETSPAQGQEIALDAGVTFYFDAELDCATAEDAVTSDNGTGVVTACDGLSLTYTPDSDLTAGEVITFTVADTLRALDGAALPEPFTLALTARGFLNATSTVPTDGAENVETNSEITIVFDRPVVPLTTLDAQAAFPQPLTFDPPLSGQGVWIGTSIYQFTPDEELSGGTDYIVTVPGLTAIDGAPLAEPFVFQFGTQNPMVSEFMPVAEEEGVPLNQKIQITFNQPMDRASTEAAFFLSIQEVPGEISGAFTWNDADTGFMFTPDELALDTSYTFGFAADAALNAAQSQAIAPFGINFYTAKSPAIVETYPGDGDLVPPYNGIVISFASTMNPETLQERIVIDPAPESIQDTYFSEYNNEYTVYFPLRGATDYTVEILPGMEDIYGNTIDEGLTFSFTTEDQSPEISFNIPYTGIGIYDADRDDTALYVTHMNVEQVDLNLFEVDSQILADVMMSQDSYNAVNLIAETPNLSLVKSWTIPGADLRNVRRLDLVDVGAPGEADASAVNGVSVVSCTGAMESRASVGDRARIITDPDPTRARSTPVNGDILELLYRDYEFPITGGPDCRDGIIWWQISLREGETAWVAEGLNGEYFFEVVQEAQAAQIPLSDVALDGGALPTGVYLLTADAPGVDERDHVMVVADTALLMKRGAAQTIVWATDIHTGLPVEGINITLRLSGLNDMVDTTDALGIAEFNYSRTSDLYSQALAFIDDGERLGITSSQWADGLYPYQFNIPVDTQPADYEIYLYLDRPVYRPGQPVYYKGVVRAKSDNDYAIPRDIGPLTLTARNSNYEIFLETTVELNDYGTFEGTLTLDGEAPLGYYTLLVTPSVEGENYTNVGVVNFDVAEYRLPEFQVTVNTDAPEYVQGDTITAQIDTTYFFGGPVANADISYYVSRETYGFDYEGTGGYSFFWYDEEALSEFTLRDYNQQQATSDAAGMVTVEIPAETGAGQRSLTYILEAVASDESGQSVSGRARIAVHQAEIYVGLAPRDYLGTVGQPVIIDAITVDLDSAAVPEQALDYTVYEMRWNSVQELSPSDGSIVWKSEMEKIPVAEGSATTGADGKAEISFTPETGGAYQIVATSTDARGNTAISATTVWVTGGDYVAWRQNNATAIQLITDKTSYQVGDTAEILITSPFMGRTEALVTLERDGVIRSERLTLESNSMVYSLPIEEDFAPTVFFGVVLIKGVDETNPVADMRVGYGAINVDNERFELNIDVARDTELAGPRDTVTYTFTVTDYTGAPVQAELGVALTDLASLSLGSSFSENILDAFYGGQSLAVLMSSGMILNTDLITEFTRDVVKGGGGGGGEGGIIELREQFIDTAFWDGQLLTDANGVATVSITLPDNLTTWRLDVRGVTDGVNRPLLVGQAEDDLIATKPLIVRPVAPRFVTRGDIVTLGAVVNNNTSQDLTTAVSIQATGVSISEELTQTVTIPANGRVRVNWTASVGDADTVGLIFSAQAGDFSDATRPAFGQGDDRLLPVYNYEVPEFVGTGGVLRTASTRVEAVVLPQRYEVTEGTLTVELEPSLAVTTLNSIEALENFECECTEATATRLLANTAGLRALNAIGNPDPALMEALRNEMNLALQRLYAQQHVDGGWGWYSTLPSDPLVTAWAVIAMREAQLDVRFVDSSVINRAVMYLIEELDSSTRSSLDYELNRAAFITYAMARAGFEGISAPVSNLYDLRDRLSIYGKALLLQAVVYANPDDTERITALRDELLNAVIISANGAHWEEAERDWYNWNSNTRTTAMALRALLLVNVEEPLLPNAVRWLMIARQGDAWETTQETAWSLLALTDWMRATGETQPNFDYTVEINGEAAAGRTVTPADAATSEIVTRTVAELNADAPNPIEITRGEGSGALYYTAYLNAYLPVPEVEAVSSGLSVTRAYRTFTNPNPVTAARVGDLIEVTVTLITPNALHYVILEDPLPAGLEAVDPGLNTAQQTGTEASFSSSESTGFDSWWWADVQYRDEKVVLSADYVAAGTYEFKYVVRATVEGTYNVIPTTGREFYLPEVYGRGEGSLFTVLPAEE